MNDTILTALERRIRETMADGYEARVRELTDLLVELCSYLEDEDGEVHDPADRELHRRAGGTLELFRTWVAGRNSDLLTREGLMAVTVTRTFFGTVVGPDHILVGGVGFFAGEELLMTRDHDRADGFDWLKTRDGLLVGVPEDAWAPR